MTNPTSTGRCCRSWALLLDEQTGQPVEETKQHRALARGDLVLCGLLALIGVVYAFQLIDIPATSPNQADIGPRAYPQLILVLLAVITTVLLVKTLRHLK